MQQKGRSRSWKRSVAALPMQDVASAETSEHEEADTDRAKGSGVRGRTCERELAAGLR